MILLVSPISSEEASQIVDTGVDIIDIKNVGEGSLGAQFTWRIREVVELAEKTRKRTSATLGDLPFKPGTAGLAAFGAAQLGVSYIKAGLHGAGTYQQACAMMDSVRRSVRMVSDTADVVAAGYADYRRFDGLAPLDLVRAARDTTCDVVMVDTAIKDGKTLFDNMTLDELYEFISASRAAGLKVGLAGSLKFEHADLLRELNPDVIGVRGAVCEGDQRINRISPERVQRFVDLFRQAVTSSTVGTSV